MSRFDSRGYLHVIYLLTRPPLANATDCKQLPQVARIAQSKRSNSVIRSSPDGPAKLPISERRSVLALFYASPPGISAPAELCVVQPAALPDAARSNRILHPARPASVCSPTAPGESCPSRRKLAPSNCSAPPTRSTSNPVPIRWPKRCCGADDFTILAIRARCAAGSDPPTRSSPRRP